MISSLGKDPNFEPLLERRPIKDYGACSRQHSAPSSTDVRTEIGGSRGEEERFLLFPFNT